MNLAKLPSPSKHKTSCCAHWSFARATIEQTKSEDTHSCSTGLHSNGHKTNQVRNSQNNNFSLIHLRFHSSLCFPSITIHFADIWC
ncbi:hypothetical protein P8452_03891 [Trifolium repens]|nr:hypothetical protein P8452_03891 [Trifolium repens]